MLRPPRMPFGPRLTSGGTPTGTDQRVARFLKRGIELTGLAVLDPIDLATAHALAASSVPISPVASNQGSTIASTSAAVAAPSSSSSSNGNGGGFFGRFKRFGANSTTSTSSNPAAKVLSSLTAGSSSSSSAEGPSTYALPLLRTRSSHTASPIIHPSRTSLSTPSCDPSHASTMATSSDRGYSFQVRKWIRSEFADASPPKSGFRLEWVRAVRRSPSSRRGGGGTTTTAAAPAGASRASSLSGRSVEVQAPDAMGNAAARPAGLSRPSSEQSSPTAATDDRPQDRAAEDRDNDDERDDDVDEEERAWICTLVYPLSSGFAQHQQHGYGAGRQSTDSTRPPPLSSSSSSASHATAAPTSPPYSSSASHPLPTTRRMHLATLQPAPHHPKLVSTLLLPPTLPSIPIGSYSPQRGLLGGVLGPEDLRDLAMVTAMWVAVREGLGALEGVVEQMVGSSNMATTTTTTTTAEGVSGTAPSFHYNSHHSAQPVGEPRTSMSSTAAAAARMSISAEEQEAASPPSAKAPPVVVVATSSSPRKAATPSPNNNNSSRGSISSNRKKGATGIVSGLFGGGGGGGGNNGARGSTLGLRERFAAATAR